MGASYVPPACSPDFGDVACDRGDWAAAWISDVKARGISKGCDLTEFCPPAMQWTAHRQHALRQDVRPAHRHAAVPDRDQRRLRPRADAAWIFPPIVNITFSPNPAVVGSLSTATITIGDPPPVTTSIALSIDNPAASVPASVTYRPRDVGHVHRHSREHHRAHHHAHHRHLPRLSEDRGARSVHGAHDRRAARVAHHEQWSAHPALGQRDRRRV